ncbi:MAG: hypothetical protein WCW53_10185 [Syntrophales bacterium]
MKKNKTQILKRQAKAKEAAKRKRQIRLVKPSSRFIERPPLVEMDAPKGFIAIPFSQAMMEFAKPLMEKGAPDIDGMSKVMELASSLWNLAMSKQKNDQKEYPQWLERATKGAKNILNLDGEERDRFIDDMIERHIHLFPEEMQPPPPSMFMYMRKDISYLIRPFDYGRIKFKVNEIIPPDEEDARMMSNIERLDDQIRKGSNYDSYEELAMSIEDECPLLFKNWLMAKGFEDDPNEYSHCLDIYLTFIYRYLHDDLVLLKSVPDQYIIEFFEDFLIRKVMCKPIDYLFWLPALKLFYRFLNEKGYMPMEDTTAILEKLDLIEPHFFEILQKRYH